MPALNRVQVIGNLGRDPETRFIPTGKQVTQFSVAVTDRWRDAEGEPKEKTEWFSMEAWGRLGEICQQYLKKGSLVFIEGRLRTDIVGEGEDRKYYTKVVVQRMQMLDRKGEEEAAPPVADEEEFPF
ncbi:MAG: single-stranded DNA-binding protein [Anaerolineales bacterium]|nr:single-stranded DNA-binding protein [Anaerolineales bacterium]